MSAVFKLAVEQWRTLRQEFELVRIAAYERAVDECNGRLLNRRGMLQRIDAFDLFIGNEARARAYASEELLSHWVVYPRLTFAEFERQMIGGAA